MKLRLEGRIIRSLKDFCKILLIAIICVQIGVPRAYAESEVPRETKPPDPNPKEINPITEDYYLDQRNREYSRKFFAFDEAYKKNTLPPSPSNYDPFKLTNQRVEIVHRGQITSVLSLNDYRLEPADIGYSSFRIHYSPQTRELIFEGVVGAKTDGSLGDVMARHIIPNMDVVAFTKDKELLTIIDSKGHIHVMDMGFVVDQLFKSPIPVVQNVWKPDAGFFEKYKPTSYRLQYHLRAIAPYQESQLTEFSVIPQNSEGKPVLTAGDVYITFNENNGSNKVLGLFARSVIHERIKEASTILLAQASLIKPKKEFLEFIALKLVGQDPAEGLLKMNPLLRNYLSNLDLNQLRTLKNRIGANEQAQTRSHDQYTLDELIQDSQKLNEEFETAKNEAEQKGLEFDDNLKDTFQKFIHQAPRENPFPKQETIMSKMLKRADSESFRRLAAIGAVAATGLYFTFPFLHDLGLTGLEIPAMNWVYENMYMDVMKDAYKHVLVKSMFSLLLMAPMVIYSCLFIQSLLKTVNKYVENNNNLFSRYARIPVRELFRHWAPLTKWEFMGSLGLRQVFLFSYPPIAAVFKYIFQQKALLSAVENGINPFKLISPESELGRMLDLKKPERAGLMNPTFNKINPLKPTESLRRIQDAVESSHQTKLKIQSALLNQKRRVQQLAFSMAYLVVSEKEQVDAATLVLLMSDDIKLEDVANLHKDPKLRKKWTLLTDDIQKSLLIENSSLLLSKDISEINQAELQKYAQIATEKARELKQRSDLSQSVNYLWVLAREQSSALVNNIPFVNLGRDKLSYLKNLYVNKRNAEQGRREFWLDYPVSILTFGLIGGRANLNDPANLTAGNTMFVGGAEQPLPAFYLWTNPVHYYDMVFTLIGGLFSSFGRMVLVFQDKQKTQPELSYLPKQYTELKSTARKQPLTKAFGDWTKGVANLEKSDLGGVFTQSYLSRIATMQAGLVMTLLLRLSLVPLGDASFLHGVYMASAGFLLYMFWSQWQYGYIDDTVRKGNALFIERFTELNFKNDEAKLKIDRGLAEPNNLEAIKLLRSGYSELVDLYELQNIPALKEIVNQYRVVTWAKKDSITLKEQLSPKEKSYYGLLINAVVASRSENKTHFEEAMRALKHALIEDQGLDALEVEKLNARTLLDYAITNPPVYTKENKALFWATQTGGLVWATYLSIDLSIMIFNPEALTPASVFKTMALSAAMVPIAYYFIGKRAGAFYNKIIRNVSQTLKEAPRNLAATLQNNPPKSLKQAPSCSLYFH